MNVCGRELQARLPKKYQLPLRRGNVLEERTWRLLHAHGLRNPRMMGNVKNLEPNEKMMVRKRSVYFVDGRCTLKITTNCRLKWLQEHDPVDPKLATQNQGTWITER